VSTPTARPTAQALDAYLAGYGRMRLIREFEAAMHRLFLRGEVHGTTHLYAGQEAVAVGVCMALDSEDYVAGTYRGHGHALAKGTPPEPLRWARGCRRSAKAAWRWGSLATARPTRPTSTSA
jgi:TPP-dependent pyruvate/acetoin dehydrogenase alpha subunit